MTARLVTMPISQRRAAVRYQLRLPVIFHWNDGGTTLRAASPETLREMELSSSAVDARLSDPTFGLKF